MKQKKLKAVSDKEVKVRFRDVVDPDLTTAMQALMNNNLPIKTSYELLKINDEIKAAQGRYEDMRMRILVKYGKKNDKGQLEMTEDRARYILEDKAAFDKEFQELLGLEVDLPKIPLSMVKELNLPATLLQPLVKTVLDTTA